MRKIEGYRKLLNVTKNAELKELKTVYRNLMKDCHPDKFQDNEIENKKQRKEAKELLKHIIFW